MGKKTKPKTVDSIKMPETPNTDQGMLDREELKAMNDLLDESWKRLHKEYVKTAMRSQKHVDYGPTGRSAKLPDYSPYDPDNSHSFNFNSHHRSE